MRSRDGVGFHHTVVPMSDSLVIALGALLGIVGGVPLAYVAAWRASRQPVEFDLDAERDLLRWVLERPGRLVRLVDLQPDHFVSVAHGELYARFRAAVGTLPMLDAAATEDRILAAERTVGADLLGCLDGLAEELGTSLRQTVSMERGMHAAQRVYDLGEDRLRYPGGAPVERGGPGEAPLVRRYRTPSRKRLVVSSLLGAAAGAVTPALAAHVWPHGTAYWFALSSLAVLSVGSIIWALVDHDTLLIDLETFFPLAALAWVLTVAADVTGGLPWRAAQGFGLSLGLAVFFRLINSAYGWYKLRTTGVKVDGMGGGDSWLVLATAGVPAALAGSVNVWYLCAMSGMLLAVVVWLVRWPTRWRIDRTTPFAFGPYLALGWILGGIAVSAGLQLW